jgi:hypothetical protein
VTGFTSHWVHESLGSEITGLWDSTPGLLVGAQVEVDHERKADCGDGKVRNRDPVDA